MNPIIKQHFDTVEARLIESRVVISYQIVKKEIAPSEGMLRIKIELIDDEAVELFEYLTESDRNIYLIKYSFHWQDKKGKLIKRWDNAPHYQNLQNSPHHIHYENNQVCQNLNVPDIFFVIGEIENAMPKT